MKYFLLKPLSLLIVVLLTFVHFTSAQMSLVPFVNNVTAVTDIQNCGDDRVFIVEQAGKIKIADLQGNLNPVPFISITARVLDGGERGLLGLAFSPDYLNDGRFYVNYTNNSGSSVISRFMVSAIDPDQADSLNEEILFTVAQPFSNHNGGAMFFGKDGYLYISLGDGGSAGDPGNRSQNLMENLGKLLRINVNVPSGFSIPGSNPYYGSVTANPRIWASGLRNAWRVSSDRMTGDIWIADVGQNLWEEIDFQEFSSPGGENYGWRCYEGNVAYNTVGCLPQSSYVAPVHVLPHTGGTCSVTGGYVYRGAEFANWFGKYFYTDYCDGIIRSLTPNGNGTFTPANHGTFQTLVYSTFGQDKYGELYVGKNTTGVLKLKDASCLPVAFIGEQDTVNFCGTDYTFSTPPGQGFLYQWFLNGSAIAGASGNTYTATQNGNYHVQAVNAQFCANNSDTITLNLIPVPAVTLTGVPQVVCSNAVGITLTGTPSGGVYTGAGVTGNLFSAAAAGVGTHVLTYTYDHGNGCVIPVSETVVVNTCTSVEEQLTGFGFDLVPNPASGYTDMIWSDHINEIKEIEVTDVTGKLFVHASVNSSANSFRLNTTSFNSGLYIVRISAGNKLFYRKLIIR